MKRVHYILALVFFAAVIFSSCSAQKCPAYGHHETEQQEMKS